MELKGLLKLYQDSPRLQQLTDVLLLPKPQKIYLENLCGSSRNFVAAALMLHQELHRYHHLFLLNDPEEAAYFFNTMENLLPDWDLFYFPSSFRRKKDFRQLNLSHVMLRSEALAKIAAGGQKKALITYPEALHEKVVVSGIIQKHILQLKTGETLDTEALLQRFAELGFTPADFVYEPGQYALRGGIIDIYTFGNEKPYRIELNNTQIDSIRIFDPETQLSEKKITEVQIIPDVEAIATEEKHISLFDFLSDHTLYWVQDYSVIKETLLECNRELENFLAQHHEAGKEDTEEEIFPARKHVKVEDFIKADDLQRAVSSHHVVFFEHDFAGNGQESVHIFSFATRPQPAFNKKFDWLIRDLQEKKQAGYEIYLFSSNPGQTERLQSIFDDLQANVDFIAIHKALHEGFTDDELRISCYTDHQIFQRYHKYSIRQAYSKNRALTLKMLRELQPGDYVTHIDHGIGIFSGLQKIEVNGRMQEAVRLIYKDNDILYVNINSLHKISKYTGKDGTPPKVDKLGSDAWRKLKEKTKKKVKEIAFDLIRLYAQRKSVKGFQHSPDSYLQTELEASFMYEDTPDQSRATAEVKKDMESPAPMDRLICGDVGFGKTEIAIRAAFKTCVDGKQAAVLVPTTILAFQHYQTFRERLKDFPVTIDYINRFKSAKEKKETLQKLKEGKTDIIIGTHALLSKDVVFKDLGLLIIDEEQKFGVGHKEKIKTLRTHVDCLTLTATPIPRTLQFSLMGARDLSIINTPPPNRQPIHTEIKVFSDDFIREAIYFENERGGQVFFIHNRIAGLQEMADLIQSLCPDLNVSVAHGQMPGHELENRILDFIERKSDVLVCTNIVESGLDIPNVNTILIHNAHQFGLSDLHQLRGRVGRSNKKAFCYLLIPSWTTLPGDARKRLLTLEQFSDLGSGFQIAMRDLDIRGAGNLLGAEQSGFIAEIGLETYQKILDEAIRELKRTEFHDLFREEISKQDDYVQDCTIDTDLEILIPDGYVENITERLSLYQRLDNCENEEDMERLKSELIDRFGPVPAPVEDLFTTLRCRHLAVKLGFEKMSLKENTLHCYFINRPDSPYFESDLFHKILQFLQTQTRHARLKQTGRMFFIVVDNIMNMQSVYEFLHRMHCFCSETRPTSTLPTTTQAIL